MESILMLVIVAGCALGEPLGAAIQRRSDSAGVYASDYARGYEPVAYAALSLHSPIPVLHVLSRVPLRAVHPDQHMSQSVQRPVYAHPYMYSPSMNHYTFDYTADADEPTILYARPNPKGGYLYRRRPVKRRPPVRSGTTEPPVIIRVHKYRIIRDR